MSQTIFKELISQKLNKAYQDTFPPFQIFVKGVDGTTLTLTLDKGNQTTVGELKEIIEGKTGLDLSEIRINWHKAIPRDNSRDHLPIYELEIHKESTLELSGSLKGGFGERAAVSQTILNNMRRGNAEDSIKKTDAESYVKIKFMRNKDFRDEIKRKVQKALGKNVSTFVLKNMMADSLGAGNCGEFANTVFQKLKEGTTGQWIYRVSMAPKDEYDHALVITYPEEVAEITDMDPTKAMVADGWHNNQVCSLAHFMDENNPYGEPLTTANFLLRFHKEATGVPSLSESDQAKAKEVILAMYAKKLKTSYMKKAIKRGRKVLSSLEQDQEVNFVFDLDVEDDQLDDQRTAEEISTVFNQAYEAGEANFIKEVEATPEDKIVEFFNASEENRNRVLSVEDTKNIIFAIFRDTMEFDFPAFKVFIRSLTDQQYVEFYKSLKDTDQQADSQSARED